MNADQKLQEQVLGGLGLEPDFAGMQRLDNWASGSNLRFQDGAARSAHLRQKEWDHPGGRKVYAFAYCLVGPEAYIYFVSDDGNVYGQAFSSITQYNVTPAGGVGVSGPRDWVFFPANNLVFGSNQAVSPFYMTPSADPLAQGVTLPDWEAYFGAGATCTSLLMHRNFMFAVGTEANPSTIFWSDVAAEGAAPLSWTPSPTNLAGSIPLTDSEGPLIAAVPMQDGLVVYKTHEAYILDFVRGTFVWSQRRLFRNLGLQTRNGCVPWNDKHVLIADNDILMHDGRRFWSIASRRTRKSIFNKIADLGACHMEINPARNEIWLGISTKDDDYREMSEAWVYNPASDAWGVRELGPSGLSVDDGKRPVFLAPGYLFAQPKNPDIEELTFAIAAWTDPIQLYAETITAIIAGAEFEGIYAYDVGKDSSDAGREFAISKSGLDFGDRKAYKIIRRVFIEGSGQVMISGEVRIGTQDRLGQPVSFGPWIPIDQAGQWIDHRRGRYLTIGIRETSGLPSEITALNVEYVRQGAQ